MNDLSGYGEVKLGDKTLPLKFGTNAYYLFCKHRNVSLDKLGEAFSDPFALIELAYFAYVSAERINKHVADVSLDEFIERVGDNENILPEFERLIMSSKMWGHTISETVDAKKNN